MYFQPNALPLGLSTRSGTRAEKSGTLTAFSFSDLGIVDWNSDQGTCMHACFFVSLCCAGRGLAPGLRTLKESFSCVQKVDLFRISLSRNKPYSLIWIHFNLNYNLFPCNILLVLALSQSCFHTVILSPDCKKINANTQFHYGANVNLLPQICSHYKDLDIIFLCISLNTNRIERCFQ